MSVVYSTLIAAGSDAGVGVVLEPPAGFLWIVRDVDVFASPGAMGASFFLQGTEGQVVWAAFWEPSKPSWFGFRGRQVVPEGSSIALSGVEASVSYTISGYQLSTP